jgi:hypothetical protein
MTTVKPQKSSKALTCYSLMRSLRWLITEVSIIIIYTLTSERVGMGPVFIIACRMGCQKQNVQELSDIFATQNVYNLKGCWFLALGGKDSMITAR